MRESKVLLVSLLALLAVLVIQGCEDEELVRPDRNRPPETILAVAPEHGDRAFHKYRVRWTGLDRDGVVVEYMVATVAEDELYGGRTSPEDIEEYLFDLPWTVTDATESLFVFSADRPNSRNHSLYVIAVDNEGKEDPTPAFTNFLAIDYGLPEVDVCMANNVTRFSDLLDDYIPAGTCAPTSPKGDTLPRYNFEEPGTPIMFTMNWEGEDPDGDVSGYRYRLDSQAEVEVSADVMSAEFTYIPDDVVSSDVWTGFHEFRVVAVDDAGAESQRSVARFVINYDPDTVIDSVWTFRRKVDDELTNVDSLPMKLVYARAWRDSPEVYGGWDDSLQYSDYVYHFGQIKIKFHGSDIDAPPDGEAPSEFRWDIAGTLLKSDWVSVPDGFCNGVACYSDTTKQKPYLDSDRAFVLSVRSRDGVPKADGSPDTMMFFVNTPPKIIDGSLTYQALPGEVRFTWDAYDEDEGYGWGIQSGEQEQALIKYRYRVDGGLWEEVQRKTRNPTRFRKEATVEGLEPGPHTFELHAYNGDYFETRADKATLDFEL